MAQRNPGNGEHVVSRFHRCDDLLHRRRVSGADCREIGGVGFEQGQIIGFPPTRLDNGGNLGFQVAAKFGKGLTQGPSLLENLKRFNGQVVILTDCSGGAGNGLGKPG